MHVTSTSNSHLALGPMQAIILNPLFFPAGGTLPYVTFVEVYNTFCKFINPIRSSPTAVLSGLGFGTLRCFRVLGVGLRVRDSWLVIGSKLSLNELR